MSNSTRTVRTTTLEPTTNDPPISYADFYDGDRDIVNIDLLEVLIELREFVDDLPLTAQTFDLDRSPLSPNTMRQYRPLLLTIVDSWECPKIAELGPSTSEKAINPHYVHDPHHIDGVIECACGTILHEGQRAEHADTCSIVDRRRAEALFWERRRDIISLCDALCCSPAVQATRLGITDKALYNYRKYLNYNAEAARTQGRIDLGRLLIHAYEQTDYTHADLAGTFGHSLRTSFRYRQLYRESSEVRR